MKRFSLERRGSPLGGGCMVENEAGYFTVADHLEKALDALQRAYYIRTELNGNAAAQAWDKWTRDTFGDTGKHYPEEWGLPKRVTCVCGNQDASHHVLADLLEQHKNPTTPQEPQSER